MEEINNPTTKRDLSISLEKANLYTLFTGGPPALLVLMLYAAVWGLEKPAVQLTASLDATISTPLRLIVTNLGVLGVFAAGVIVHELIHGLTWKLAARKPWSAIRFGFDKRTFTPYAHCREPLPAGAYRVGTLLPGILTGLVPALVGVAIGNLWVTLAGALFLFSAGGDLLVLLVIRKVPGATLVEDHPSRAGCYVLEAGR